jgi:S-formylglutathione hydrolase FrmB
MGNGPVTHVLPAKFPVVYLLHGFANNHAQWTGYTNVELYAEERRIAIVNISAENKAYAKVGADDFKRFVSEELPEFVTNYFPISTAPEDTYIAGLSMGGYGALMHGLTRPERYHAIGAFSAGFGHQPGCLCRRPDGAGAGKDRPGV